MDRFTKDLKEALGETPMITVKRSSLENLIATFEKEGKEKEDFLFDYYTMHVRDLANRKKIDVKSAALILNRLFGSVLEENFNDFLEEYKREVSK